MDERRALQYIELDVDRCALNYSELPCHAQLGYADGSDPGMTGMHTESARRNGGLTGAADSKSATGSLWFWLPDVSGNKTLFCSTTTAGGTTTRFRVRMVGNELRITASDTGGTVRLDIRSPGFEALNTYHVLFSFDLNVSGRRHIYVDDGSNITQSTFLNANIDFTVADWAFGSLPNGTEAPADGFYFSQFWFHDGLYLNLDDESNRRKFISSDKRPVWLGDNGEVPTGGAPRVFFPHLGDGWEVNEGTGGSFNTIINDGNAAATYMQTGSIKCFNTFGTCQDRDNYDDEGATLRFAIPTADLPNWILCIPSIKTIDFQPAQISIGENLGERAVLTVTFTDHRDSDTGPAGDKYVSERPYTPFEQGTFWGKFRARRPYLFGKQLRWITGFLDQDTAEWETRYFIVDSFSGPSTNGEYKIVAKDILKLADGDKALAPIPNTGFLTADISDTDTTLTLGPSGIGDDEYPDSGYASIGDSEIVGFDRSGDTLTFFERGAFNTEASDHAAQDKVQVCYRADAAAPHDLIWDLLVNYAGIDEDYIDYDAWNTEVTTYVNRLYSTIIANPTAVVDLVSELCEQAGLSMWWDDRTQLIGMKALHGIVSNAPQLNPDNIIADSMEITEQPERRISQMHTYFGQKNPLTSLTDKANYRSSAIAISEVESFYGTPAIKEIFSRWIPEGGRTIADRLNTMTLGRFENPPRHFKLDVLRDSVPEIILANGYDVLAWPMQDATGAPAPAQMQVTKMDPAADLITVEGDEVLFNASDEDLADRTVIIDSSINNMNFREVHDRFYTTPADGDTVTLIINSGIIIGSESIGLPALDMGDWPSGVTINVTNGGTIQGHGGNGGGALTTSSFTPGQDGGTALYTRVPINMANNGQIWGGGGGGGYSANNAGPANVSQYLGGGGAGTNGGAEGHTAVIANFLIHAGGGTQSAGGTAPNSPTFGGSGGGPGLAGVSPSSGNIAHTAGGAAGAAVDGDSFVTYSANADMRGPQIN